MSAFQARLLVLSKVGLLAASAAAVAWSITSNILPSPAVRLTAAVVACSLALAAWAIRTRWQACAGWVAVAFAGQACSFQLLEAGHLNRLQLFLSWQSLLTSYRIVFLVTMVVLAGIAVWAARRKWHSTVPFSGVAPWPEVLAFGMLLCFSVAVFSPETVQAILYGGLTRKALLHATKIGLGLLIAIGSAVAVALAAAAIPDHDWNKLAGWWKGISRAKLIGLAALLTSVVSSLLFWFVMDRMPHIPDDVGFLFQAKYFAAGRLYLPVPPEPQAFNMAMTLVDGDKWYSALQPGWPAVLALGVRTGVPWLVNPLLAGLSILLAYAFVRRLYDENVAVATALLLAGSPWLLYISASYMGHAISLLLLLGALTGAYQARERGSLLGAATAGLCLGSLAIIRPLEALAVAVVIGIWWLAVGWKRLRLAPVILSASLCLALTGLMLAYNNVISGDPFLVPFQKVTDLYVYKGANRIGFGTDVGNFGWEHLDPLPGHGPIDVIVNTNQNLYMVNFELFGWASGSLLFVYFLMVFGRFREDALMWGLVLALWAAMSCYWFSGGPDYGARYWYLMIFPLTVLTVRGVIEFGRRWSAASALGINRRIWGFVVLSSLIALVNVIPWRAIDKYKNYRGIRGDVRELERKYKFGRSLVFVRGETKLGPFRTPVYASAFALNPNTLDRDAPGPIYVRDLGPDSRNRLRSYYFDRPVWIVLDPVSTGDGFVVLEGPLPAGSPPAEAPDAGQNK